MGNSSYYDLDSDSVARTASSPPGPTPMFPRTHAFTTYRIKCTLCNAPTTAHECMIDLSIRQ